jgi:hypothetical protein
MEKKEKISFISTIITINIVITSLIVFLYHYFFTPKFLFFDDFKHIQNLKNAYIAGKITDDELQKKFEELNNFSKKLKPNEILFKETSILGKGKNYED